MIDKLEKRKYFLPMTPRYGVFLEIEYKSPKCSIWNIGAIGIGFFLGVLFSIIVILLTYI